MTDKERDEIDSAAQDFIHSCSEKIDTLRQKGTRTSMLHNTVATVYTVCMHVHDCTCTCTLYILYNIHVHVYM